MIRYVTGPLSKKLFLLPLALVLAGNLSAQARRITRPIDEADRMSIQGTVHPHATSSNFVKRAAPDLRMNRMLLMLQGKDEQETELQALLAAQQDPNSPQYRQWLTPEQFGQQFGPASEDIAAVVAWLQQQGFTVNEVAASHRTVEFSGEVQQVEQAFVTEMGEYRFNGEAHLANGTEISLPTALAGVVAGVASLHDFHPVPLHHRSPLPLTDLSGGAHAMSPFDFAAIYNVGPLWKNGIDGTGQTIAIVGRTNINLSDVTSFRSQFGLAGNNTQVIVNGTDPGVVSQGEATEALLDVEWSGGVAKNAAINFVVSASTNSTGGDVLSAQYIVNHNSGTVLSYSFGLCESQMGSENQFFNSLWAQAAAQGITVVVAAGDSGSAGCDVPSSSSRSNTNTTKPATGGLAVNGLASTPYNVAVGGTGFHDTSNAPAYWNASNDTNHASAIGYIPEVVWNESSYTSSGASGNGLWAGGGGVSSLYATPVWQTGAGVPSVDPGAAAGQHHRYLPDVALSGAGHDAYLIVQSGSLYGVGGTSAAAPSFAGIIALANQQAKGTTGNAGPVLYSIAAQFPSAFHDITSGTNAVPCVAASLDCIAPAGTNAGTTTGVLAGFSAGPGYDLATGLGSVDAFKLVMSWPAGRPIKAPAPSISSLNPNPITASPSNQTLTINGAAFQSGAKVQLIANGITSTLPASQVTFVSAAKITAVVTVNVTVGSTAGAFGVQVLNPDGQSSAAAILTVVLPSTAPTVSGLNPNPMTGSSSSQILTITGTGFVSGAKVTLAAPGSTPVVYQGSQQLLVGSSTQITVLVNVGTLAQTWSVAVTNPNGQSSASTALTVTASGKTSGISITSLTPNPFAASSQMQVLMINGAGFTAATNVQFFASQTIAGAKIYGVWIVSSTQIAVELTLGTTPQTWNVQVSANGRTSNQAALTVQ